MLLYLVSYFKVRIKNIKTNSKKTLSFLQLGISIVFYLVLPIQIKPQITYQILILRHKLYRCGSWYSKIENNSTESLKISFSIGDYILSQV